MGDVLNPRRVQKILGECLFREGEDTLERVTAQGLGEALALHRGRLENHRSEVVEMLGELPDDFKSSRGCGGSFLDSCLDRHGELWTGEHRIMDQLLTLGIALGEADFCLPREQWDSFPFPGGLPFFMVKQ